MTLACKNHVKVTSKVTAKEEAHFHFITNYIEFNNFFRYTFEIVIRHWAFIVITWLAFDLNVTGQGVNASKTPAKQFTSVRQVLELSASDAEQHSPVHFKGFVTCSDGPGAMCFVTDGSAGIYLLGINPVPDFGERIEIFGRSGAGLYSPIVLVDKFQALAKTNLPAARSISIEELKTGRHDSEWVELEGVVIRQIEEAGHIVLTLLSGRSSLNIRIFRYNPQKVPDWVNARIKVRGVAAVIFDNQKQVSGFHLLTQSTNLVSVISPAPADPFSESVTTSRKLLSYRRDEDADRRSLLRGTVTFFWPGREFYIRDDHSSVRVHSRQTNSLAVGDLVEVAGFRNLNETRPALVESVYRKIGQGSLPKPRPILASDAVKGDLDGEVVTVVGAIMQGCMANSGYSALILQSDQKVFRACLQDDWDLGKEIEIPGARAQITGVLTRNPPQNGVSESFSIWMRSPSDSSLLAPAPPPVRDQKQLAYMLGTAGSAVGLLGAWVFLARLRVGRRTKEMQVREAALEERFRDLYENANDIIYSHKLDGAIISMNNAGQVLFGYTEVEFRKMNISQLLDPEDLENARTHTKEKLTGAPRTTYELRLRSRDGRRLFFDINSRLIFKDGQPVGVQGIARDITQRRLAEEALRVSERQLRASLEERERLARDLHDGIIQSIYATGLNLEDTLHVVRNDPEKVENRIRKMTDDLNQIIREVRGFIMGLESHRLKGEELKAALRALALTAGESKSSQVELLIDETVATRLSATEATQLLQIAREALSNSIRHAHANRLVFVLKQSQNGGVVFELSDDGVGFNPAASRNKGFGLRNMAARAEEISADFRIFSQNGEGTRIVLDMSRPTAEKLGA